MDYAKFIALLKKQKLSEQEQKQLEDWKKKDPELTGRLQQIWDWSGLYEVSYRPDTEKGLEQLRQRIREEQTTRPSRGVRIRVWQWVAAAAVVLGLAIGLPLLSGPEMIVFQTAANDIREVTLPDGSNVVLNENSTLQVTADFVQGKKRAVSLKGEAFFEVEADPSHPFVIKTLQTSVSVLGTEFNLRAYPDEDSTIVEVLEGKVHFADQKEKLELKANMRGACDHLTKKMESSTQQQIERPDWYHQRAVSFREAPLAEVLNFMEERFKIDMVLSEKVSNADQCAAAIVFSIQTNEPLGDVIKRLERILNGKIVAKGENRYEIINIEC